MIDAVNYLRIQLAARMRSERGASAVEYGLLVVLIALLLIVGAKILGSTLSDMFSHTASSLKQTA